jgi:predicted MPP superfamily phosphohydrolase
MADFARSTEAVAPRFEESEWRPAEAGEATAPPAPSRDAWRLRRLDMEARQVKHTPTGAKKRRHWVAFKALMKLFGKGLKLVGAYRMGVANALAIQETEITLEFAELPAAFDGFEILQMSDLHVDALPGAFQAALDLAAARPVDLCVLTGDYRFRVSGPFDQILPAFEALVDRVEARHGILAILGNHDGAGMVEPLEALGIRVLINETATILRGGSELHLTGTDDVHYFYTDEARNALARAPDGFKLALIHSAELADAAAEHGFQLYLAGHTHGGQICLPGGRPILTHLSRFRQYARGLWHHGAMTGYTSTGVGVSGLPVRFNNRGEIVRIVLRRAPGSS